MYHQSCTGIVHQTYYSKKLSVRHNHSIYLTECRNMPTDSDLWTSISYSDLNKIHRTPCKLCLTQLERRIGFSIREYCRLFGHGLDAAFVISDKLVPNVIVKIKGE